MLLFTYHKKLIGKAKIFLTQTPILMSLVQWCRKTGGPWPPNIWQISWPYSNWGWTDYAHQLLLASLICFTFRHHCGLLTWFTSGISKCNDYQLTSFLTYSTVDGMVMVLLEENIKKSKFGPTESSRDMLWCCALKSGTMGAKVFWSRIWILKVQMLWEGNKIWKKINLFWNY